MAKKFEMPVAGEKDSNSEGRIKILQEVVDRDKRKKSDARIEILKAALEKGKGSKKKEAEPELLELDAELPPEVPEYAEYKVDDGEENGDAEIEDARAELAERMETLKARQELRKKWKGSKKKEVEPEVDASGEFEVEEKEEPAKESVEKVIVEAQEEVPVYELTKKKNIFDPEKISLDELDDRVQALWRAMDGVLKDAVAWKDDASKEERKKLKKFTKKGGEWPIADIVTAKNYKKELEKYGVAEYINPSLIDDNRDAYAVVSKQYGIYRDALEKRIRKAKLKQLEEVEGKPSSKKEKKEREKEVTLEIEAELPPQPPDYVEQKIEPEVIEMEAEQPEKGEGMPWELKKKLGEEIEVQDEDITEIEEIRENLKEPDKEWDKAAREFKGDAHKKKKIKKEKLEPEEDSLGIGEVLREDQKEHVKKIGIKSKAAKKKGFWARLFSRK